MSRALSLKRRKVASYSLLLRGEGAHSGSRCRWFPALLARPDPQVIGGGIREALFSPSRIESIMKKILFVEDEAALQTTLGGALQKEGFAVVAARDGETGLHLAASEHPDLILLDLI